MEKLEYLWGFENSFLKTSTYQTLKSEICQQLIDLTKKLICEIQYQNRTYLSKVILTQEIMDKWKQISTRIECLAPNCDFVAQRMELSETSDTGKSSYYEELPISRETLLTKISVVIIELTSSAEAFLKNEKELRRRIQKLGVEDGRVPGRLVGFRTICRLKNQRKVLQKIFETSKNIDREEENHRLAESQWMLDVIMKDRILTAILDRDEIVQKTLGKLRELSKFAFSIYEDKLNEQILNEENTEVDPELRAETDPDMSRFSDITADYKRESKKRRRRGQRESLGRIGKKRGGG